KSCASPRLWIRLRCTSWPSRSCGPRGSGISPSPCPPRRSGGTSGGVGKGRMGARAETGPRRAAKGGAAGGAVRHFAGAGPPGRAAGRLAVAMCARGGAASSEAADVVLMVDRLDRLEEGIGIARRSRNIALQSILAGMGLSLLGMGFAAAGRLTPVAGALLQE